MYVLLYRPFSLQKFNQICLFYYKFIYYKNCYAWVTEPISLLKSEGPAEIEDGEEEQVSLENAP